MTHEKKLHMLTEYCTTRKSCEECVLNSDRVKWEHPLQSDRHCLSFSDASEEELDEALALISGNPYWYRITKLADRQRAKGVAAYGQGLEDNLKPNALERIEYIQEELIDGLMYLEWLKEKLKGEMKNAAEKED